MRASGSTLEIYPVNTGEGIKYRSETSSFLFHRVGNAGKALWGAAVIKADAGSVSGMGTGRGPSAATWYLWARVAS